MLTTLLNAAFLSGPLNLAISVGALVVVVAPDDDERATVARACGATPTDRSDRQAGYLPPSALGRCARWVSTVRTSHVLPSS